MPGGRQRSELPGRRIAMIGIGGVLLATLLIATGERAVPTSRPLPAPARKVVIFGMPHLGVGDLAGSRLPELSKLARGGAIGTSTIRTASDLPSTIEAYASLGAGVAVAGRPAGGDAISVSGSARLAPPVWVRGGRAVVKATPPESTSQAGALGQALHAHHHRVAVLGGVDPGAPAPPNRPAAIALMDAAHRLDHGVLTDHHDRRTQGPELLRAQPTAPFGVESDPAAFRVQTARLLQQSDVLIIDPGDTDRAAAESRTTGSDSVGTAASRRRQALLHTDLVLGQVVRSLPPGTLLLVVGVTPPTSAWDPAPIVASGPGITRGYLVSPSTHRAGLVTLYDVAPTVLSALGITPPSGMVGGALRQHPDPKADAGRLVEINRLAALRDAVQPGAMATFIAVQIVVYLGLVVAFRLRGNLEPAGLTRYVVLTLAAWPLATFVYRALPAALQLGHAGQIVVWLLAGFLAAVAGRFRGAPLRPLQVIAAATVFVIAVDVATGARLELSGLLGYSPQTNSRFTGIGNSVFAVFAAAGLLVGLLHLDRLDHGGSGPGRRAEALVAVGVLFGLIVVVDGWPTLGGDVGGTLTLLPVLGLTLYLASGHRLRARAVLLAVGAGVLLALGMGALDLMRPAAQQTHLGRFASDVLGGKGDVGTTLARKWSESTRPLRASPFSWLVPVLSLGAVYAMVVRGAWQRLLPKGSAPRLAVVAMLLLGLVGSVVNDSGIAITLLAAVYIGPLVVLEALGPDPVSGETADGAVRTANPSPRSPSPTPRVSVSAVDRVGEKK